MHVYTESKYNKSTLTAPSMNELQLELLRLRQQVNAYKALITNRDQLLQEIYDWRNRFTTKKALYGNVYTVILDKLDTFASNLKTSLKKNSHSNTHA